MAKWGKFHEFNHRTRLLRRADVWRDDPYGAAIQHAADLLRGSGRQPNERRDSNLLGGNTNLAARVDGLRIVLQIDVECVETGGLRDLRALDGPGEAYGHGRHDFVSRQLFLHVVS